MHTDIKRCKPFSNGPGMSYPSPIYVLLPMSVIIAILFLMFAGREGSTRWTGICWPTRDSGREFYFYQFFISTLSINYISQIIEKLLHAHIYIYFLNSILSTILYILDHWKIIAYSYIYIHCSISRLSTNPIFQICEKLLHTHTINMLNLIIFAPFMFEIFITFVCFSGYSWSAWCKRQERREGRYGMFMI